MVRLARRRELGETQPDFHAARRGAPMDRPPRANAPLLGPRLRSPCPGGAPDGLENTHHGDGSQNAVAAGPSNHGATSATAVVRSIPVRVGCILLPGPASFVVWPPLGCDLETILVGPAIEHALRRASSRVVSTRAVEEAPILATIVHVTVVHLVVDPC